jgi:hypothetical protein
LSDWTLVDDLRDDVSPLAGFFYSYRIDFRRPTINYMGTSSGPLATLNGGGSTLPATVKYGTLVFDGATLGLLDQSHAYNVFTGLKELGITYYPALTLDASNAVCNFSPISGYRGDGIVPMSAQTFVAAGINVSLFKNSMGILHLDETGQLLSIRSAMNGLVNWWNP